MSDFLTRWDRAARNRILNAAQIEHDGGHSTVTSISNRNT